MALYSPVRATIVVKQASVLFRCNASASVGLGHLMRCRTLAGLLRGAGHVCGMIGPSSALRQPDDAALFQHWQSVDDRGESTRDAARVITLAKAMNAVHLVMDDYRIDPAYQMLLKAAGLRFLQQFDASKPWDFYADVLVNAGPAENRVDYAKYLKNAEAQTLFGPAYAVLRPAFAAQAKQLDGRPVHRVLIAFGGGDDRGAISTTLDALTGVPDIIPVVVSGGSNPRNADLQLRYLETVELHIDPENLPKIMAGCDLAIIAGGTMSYEAAICGLPMVLIPLAPNQTRSCDGWAQQTGAMVMPGLDQLQPTQLRKRVLELIANDALRLTMAVKGRSLVDGNGGVRLLEALLLRPLNA